MENLERAQKETEEFSEEMRQRVERAKNMDISDLKGAVQFLLYQLRVISVMKSIDLDSPDTAT